MRLLLTIALVALAAGSAALAAETPPGPLGQEVWERVNLAGTGRSGYQNGPSAGSQMMNGTTDGDDLGNAYWMERGAFAVLRRYNASSKRAETFAGSSNGLLDGPLEVARFSSGSYMDNDDAKVSLDGKWIYVGDPGNGRILRLVDVEKGTVTTVKGLKGVMSHDVGRTGTCYAATGGGIFKVTPDGKVEKLDHLQPRPGNPKEMQFHGGTRARSVAIDEENGFLYAMTREKKNRFWRWDLKTGKVEVLFDPNYTPGPGGKYRKLYDSGSGKGASTRCPSGISIRPGQDKNFWYWGDGDGRTFNLFDNKQCWYWGLKPIGGEKFAFAKTNQMQQPAVGTWAFAPQWDSHGNMFFGWSIRPRIILFKKVK